MNQEIRHFILTPDGGLREFTAEQAARVASGTNPVPEFASQRVRYVQVSVDPSNGTEVRVQTGTACIEFDADGKLAGTVTPQTEAERVSKFEYDAAVQWVLNDLPSTAVTFH